MTMSTYLCRIVGESPQRAARFHQSTVRRTTAFAIAIHIPVILWALTSFVIAAGIFHLNTLSAAVVGLVCAGLVYLVERIVLATPKGWFINISRLIIGVVISILGASTVDLVIFDREISEQLQRDGEARLVALHDTQVQLQVAVVAQKKIDWFKAHEAAACEANGTCGSRVRSVGPVYRELARQADLLHRDFSGAQDRLTQLQAQKAKALDQWHSRPPSADRAGLLARVQALHAYTTANTAAQVAWILFFVLILFFELMVVLSKMVFGETVDDVLDRMREDISRQKAQEYVNAITSPLALARSMIDDVYRLPSV
ncbi:DUF4407 domain-containing protein [Polaromonas sp. CG_9.2]|uniref:DUF4407 domain-containing protein n=2 Tax=unclassified Polaromonas TaxID=2638319 RepID=UPI0018CA8CB1|nr:DUF4407 domain-containing protein [Polaromonas sp. CG_9.2]MBG6073427.1 hypothetical protein [Polaromonas sp. CG_9.7]